MGGLTWPVLAPDPQLPLRGTCGQRDAAPRVGGGGEVGSEGTVERQRPDGLYAVLRAAYRLEGRVGAVGQEELPGAVAVQVSGAGSVEVAAVRVWERYSPPLAASRSYPFSWSRR